MLCSRTGGGAQGWVEAAGVRSAVSCSATVPLRAGGEGGSAGRELAGHPAGAGDRIGRGVLGRCGAEGHRVQPVSDAPPWSVPTVPPVGSENCMRLSMAKFPLLPLEASCQGGFGTPAGQRLLARVPRLPCTGKSNTQRPPGRAIRAWPPRVRISETGSQAGSDHIRALTRVAGPLITWGGNLCARPDVPPGSRREAGNGGCGAGRDWGAI